MEFLQALNWSLLVLPEVQGEAQRLRGSLDEEGQYTWLPADWSPLERSARMTLHVADPANEVFLNALIAASEHLTDVDATAVALAGSLGLPLLSDDNKVRRIFQQQYPALELRATLSLIRDASTRLGLEKETPRDVLSALRWKARFAPPRQDPLRQWFLELTQDG